MHLAWLDFQSSQRDAEGNEMTRLMLNVGCALLMLQLALPATATAGGSSGGNQGRGYRKARVVKPVKKHRRYRTKHRSKRVIKRGRKAAGLKRKRIAARKKVTKQKVRKTNKKRQVKTRKATRSRRHVKLSLRRFGKAERAQMMKLMASKRVRGSRQAQQLVAEFIRLKAVSGKGMPFGVKALSSMTRSSRWSPRRMANLAKVLRLARHIAKRDGVSINKAFGKALKAAGVAKKYSSGRCKA